MLFENAAGQMGLRVGTEQRQEEQGFPCGPIGQGKGGPAILSARRAQR